jgi:NitT/TauT family transport system substrate-binding protein
MKSGAVVRYAAITGGPKAMPLTLFEPFRAVFYTPFYAAHALDAYGAEGVDVRLLTSGAEATVSGLIDGSTDVSWGGPMRIQYTYDQQPDCGVVSFCEIVTRDPFFIVGRGPRPDFQMPDLLNVRFGAVSEVNTPWLCLQEDLRRAGLNPAQVNRVEGNTMTANDAALRAGDLDAIQIFQPFVEQLVADGAGHIWYAAASRGAASYTTLSTLKATLQTKRDQMGRMTRALYRTQKWLHGADAPAIAAAIADFFPDLPQETLAACIKRYKALGLWGVNPILPRGGFDRLQASGLSGGLFKSGAPFEECVDISLAREAIEADPPSM